MTKRSLCFLCPRKHCTDTLFRFSPSGSSGPTQCAAGTRRLTLRSVLLSAFVACGALFAAFLPSSRRTVPLHQIFLLSSVNKEPTVPAPTLGPPEVARPAPLVSSSRPCATHSRMLLALLPNLLLGSLICCFCLRADRQLLPQRQWHADYMVCENEQMFPRVRARVRFAHQWWCAAQPYRHVLSPVGWCCDSLPSR